jgi:soluble lytic murein transglycosylase-like protein
MAMRIAGVIAGLFAATATAVSAQDLPLAASAPALPDTGPALIARNSPQAVGQLCQLARRGDAESQYQLAWVFTHGKGDDRRDDWAAYLFYAAASQGHDQARHMLQSMTWPAAEVPACMMRAQAPPKLAADAPTVAVKAPPHIEQMVQRLAPQFRVDPKLALSIIAVESNFDSYAVSRSSAMGLMQLIPQTARRFGVRNAFDAQQNLRGGLAYLRWLLAYYEGDVSLVAAAYNAGEGAVDRHRGVPPFEETREYVRRVTARYGNAPHPFDARIAAPSAQLANIRARR